MSAYVSLGKIEGHSYMCLRWAPLHSAVKHNKTYRWNTEKLHPCKKNCNVYIYGSLVESKPDKTMIRDKIYLFTFDLLRSITAKSNSVGELSRTDFGQATIEIKMYYILNV